jgi:hypothetical protein
MTKRLVGDVDESVIWLIKQAMYPLLPRSSELPGLVDTDLDSFLRRLRRESNSVFWTGLWLGALVFACTPLITLGVPLPAFLLPRRMLERHTARIIAHRVYLVRQALSVVRLIAGMCWGADPRVRACFALEPYPADPGTFRAS